MLDRLKRSWEMAKMSYAVLWHHKRLLAFPAITGVAAALVLASFALPLWGLGLLEQWSASREGESDSIAMAVVAFLFYFVNYFVIVFFNGALIGCTSRVLAGEAPTLGDGIAMAGRRVGSIAQWALVSAVVGLILRGIESSSERGGEIISAVIGAGWTALTYFVAPVLVMEGLGPVASVKRSYAMLKESWGEALVGNFSVGLIGVLTTVPLVLAVGFLAQQAAALGSPILAGLVLAVGAAAVLVSVLANAAADGVLKAILHRYASGGETPAEADDGALAEAFVARR